MSVSATQQTLFDDLQDLGREATFADAQHMPLHSWYPYLEGYSVQFVERMYSQFMPEASSILDPFAGTGTTPVASSLLGLRSAYCETNPLLRDLLTLKLKCLALDASRRNAVANTLNKLADNLVGHLNRVDEDAGLVASYTEAFGKSAYFPPATYIAILKYRRLCDTFSPDDLLVSRLAYVAALRNLIPVSYLKRAGDVRFKTERELAKGLPDFIPVVAQTLNNIADDLRNIESAAFPSELVSTDARSLRDIPPTNEYDGVITSPPYLNGTNYIRNTKLELWFGRYIRGSSDMRQLRDTMVISGINDVSRSNRLPNYPEECYDVVKKLEENAYDSRIPQMVAGYFADMERVLDGLHKHLRDGAMACIDIGDSSYGGVRVPTPEVLRQTAKRIGFDLHTTLPLRERVSRDQSKLVQEVIVLQNRRSRRISYVSGTKTNSDWAWFFDSLPHKKPPYSSRNWGHPLHSACSYRGKLKPAIAHFLIKAFSKPGGRVLDPFAGAGTIPFEAALQGRESIGFDLSRMGAAITRAKTGSPDRDELNARLVELENHIADFRPSSDELRSAQEVAFNKPIPEYFHSETLREILACRDFFRRVDDTDAISLMLTCMLHILHGNRPYALSRRSHPITPFAPTGEYEYRDVMSRLRTKIDRVLTVALPSEYIPGTSYSWDARDDWSHITGQVDTVITSPPFAGSTRFYMQNWMRFWFCGWEREDFERSNTASYLEDRQRNGFDCYRPILENISNVLSADGCVVFHLGESNKHNMAEEFSALASDLFRHRYIFTEDVQGLESHGVSDKGATKSHQYLVLER